MKFSWDDNNDMEVLPRLVLTASAPSSTSFSPKVIQNFKDEGYDVTYLPFNGDHKAFRTHLSHLADPLELGEKYAIVGQLRYLPIVTFPVLLGCCNERSKATVTNNYITGAAYGTAASLTLEACIKPMPKLCALVAYYPPSLPHVNAGFPSSLRVIAHLAGKISSAPKWASYTYPHAEAGFAEEGTEAYEKVSAGLAWSRTLGVLRKGFEIEVDLEGVWERHLALEFSTKDVDATMSTMVPAPYVNHIPTLTGGIGHKELHRFYKDFFIPMNPPSLNIRLLSRTVGTDRVVDEMFVKFRHTQEIPWLLPGVPPTNKEVEVAFVSVVCIRGGKLYHEHIYWDQATVLVQIGLLDPKLVPKGKGVQRLPVVGKEGARKVLDERSVESNQLIPDW